MKQCIDTYVEPVTVLINNSFYHGIFSDELKLSRVVSIFKSGDSSKINNCRPVKKKFSKNNNVFNFMNENKLIYKYQFGVRQKHSTQQAKISLVDKITKSLDSGDIVVGVFVVEKSIRYCITKFFKKMFAYGICDNILEWFDCNKQITIYYVGKHTIRDSQY